MSLMDRGWLMLTACNMGLIVLRVGSVGSPKGPRNNKLPLIGLTQTSRATQ
jgi:uncharacterized protein related to proFAR isomerase